MIISLHFFCTQIKSGLNPDSDLTILKTEFYYFSSGTSTLDFSAVCFATGGNMQIFVKIAFSPDVPSPPLPPLWGEEKNRRKRGKKEKKKVSCYVKMVDTFRIYSSKENITEDFFSLRYKPISKIFFRLIFVKKKRVYRTEKSC